MQKANIILGASYLKEIVLTSQGARMVNGGGLLDAWLAFVRKKIETRLDAVLDAPCRIESHGKVNYATRRGGPHRTRTAPGLHFFNSKGYIAPSAAIYHPDVRFGSNVFIGDRVIIFMQRMAVREVRLGTGSAFLRDTIIETGDGGSLTLVKMYTFILVVR